MVRIIAGEFRSRRLLSPRTAAVRPTSDRVKESLFQILAPRLAGARVLDLYAGTGNLGLEALSRGAAACCFVERSASFCAIIRKNIARLGLEERTEVLRLDCPRALGLLAKRGDRFSLALADPPYAKKKGMESELKKILLALDGCDTLAPGALVVAEHFKCDPPQERLAHLRIVGQRRYGDTVISFFAVPEK